MASFMQRMGGMLRTSEHTIKLDHWERMRVERHMREVAEPEWREANKDDKAAPPLTFEEVLHGLLIDGLAKAEADAGLVGLLFGTATTDGKPWIPKAEYDRIREQRRRERGG